MRNIEKNTEKKEMHDASYFRNSIIWSVQILKLQVGKYAWCRPVCWKGKRPAKNDGGRVDGKICREKCVLFSKRDKMRLWMNCVIATVFGTGIYTVQSEEILSV